MDMQSMEEKNRHAPLFCVVLEGGPCAGKTTALKLLKSYFTQKGWTVITLSEAATRLLESGFVPGKTVHPYEFQKAVLQQQILLEDQYRELLKTLPGPHLLICDRGMLDTRVYLSQEESQSLLREFRLDQEEIIKRYDAIFHLVSTAIGAEEAYSVQNNPFRMETREEAADQDNKVKEVWSCHPHFWSIGNEDGLEGKMTRLITLMEQFLDNKTK